MGLLPSCHEFLFFYANKIVEVYLDFAELNNASKFLKILKIQNPQKIPVEINSLKKH